MLLMWLLLMFLLPICFVAADVTGVAAAAASVVAAAEAATADAVADADLVAAASHIYGC